MRKLFSLFALFALTIFLFTSCNKDCVCKYYDSNNTLLTTDIFDGDELSSSECVNYDNLNTEVNNQVVTASYVSCSSSEW